MSLEALYNNADPQSYVGQVRTKQEAEANTTMGVNFMDGTRRGPRPTPDEFQTEFTRNRPNTFVVGGAQGSVPATTDKSYPLSRWTPKSLKLAFEQEGPASLNKGYYIDRFRTATSNAGSVLVHNYTPLRNKGFKDLNNSARARIVSSPTSYF